MTAELEALSEFLTGSKLSPTAVPWWLLRPEDLRVIRTWAAETLTTAGQRALMRSLRTILRHELPPPEDPTTVSTATPLSTTLLRGRSRQPASRGMGPREARRLIDMCRDADRLEGRRDCALIALMLLAGLRRTELVGLAASAFDYEDERLTIRSARSGLRSVVLRGECLDCLLDWLRARGSWHGPMFVRIDAEETLLPEALSLTAVNRVLSRRAAEAACTGVTPRDLRARFLHQLQVSNRRDERPPCRYYQDESGQPAWTLASMQAV